MAARPEITGRSFFAINEPSKTISEFCRAERISRSKYYKLKKSGNAPDEMRADGIIRITPESHARWRRKHTGPPPKSSRPVRELPRGRGTSP
jgi:hypothetical protein